MNVAGNVGVGQSLTVSSAAVLDSLSVTKSISGATLGISGVSNLTGNVGIGASVNVTSVGVFGSIQNNGGLNVNGTSYLQDIYGKTRLYSR